MIKLLSLLNEIKYIKKLNKNIMNNKIILGIVVAIVAIAGSIYAYNANSSSKDCCKMASNETACDKDNCVCETCTGDQANCDEACKEKACCSKTSTISSADALEACSNEACDETCTCGDSCEGEGCDCPCTACK